MVGRSVIRFTGAGVAVVALAGTISFVHAAFAQSLRSRSATSVARQDVSAAVARMMALDKNGDGKLTRDEVKDPRLLRLFDRADSNHDGVVTRAELTALLNREPAPTRGPRFGPGGGDPDGGGFGGPGGPGGFGGPGGPGFGPPPGQGQVLPEPLQRSLGLSAGQKRQIASLQAEVDARLAKILTRAQTKQLAQMRTRPPFGGPGGQGGPDGPPPDGFGPPGAPGPR